MIDTLLTRRSVKAAELQEPGPSDEQLQHILTAATRVPDHGKLAPWRLHVLHKAGQEKLGQICADRFKELNDDANEKQVAFERDRLTRAPLLVAVIYTPQFGRIPEWEQQLSAGACCMNLLHACDALGFGAQWLTEWIAFDEEIKKALGGGDDDQIAGFIYIGSYNEKPEDRPRPDLNDVVRHWRD